MAAPLLSKVWTVTPNVRKVYSSLANTVGWCLYQNKARLVAAGWTVKWTCDGATGPATDGDNTDRWASETDADNRGANASAAQSFAVLQNSDGLQVLLAFQGAADHNARIAYSPGGLYARAGTVTFQPTATDEVVIHAPGDSLVNSTTSGDRVMSIWTTADTKHWSFALFRAAATINIVGVELVNNLAPNNVFGTTGSNNIPYIGYRYTNASRASSLGSPCDAWPNVASGATGALGAQARIYTGATLRTTRLCGGLISVSHVPGTSSNGAGVTAAGVTAAGKPAIQNSLSSPILPVYLFGEKTANLDGLLGYPIDWWQVVTATNTVPATADFVPGYEPGDTVGVTPVRSNWLVALGSAMLRPWKNAAASLETT